MSCRILPSLAVKAGRDGLSRGNRKAFSSCSDMSIPCSTQLSFSHHSSDAQQLQQRPDYSLLGCRGDLANSQFDAESPTTHHLDSYVRYPRLNWRAKHQA